MRTKRIGKASRAPGRPADDGWGSLGQRGMDDGGSTLLPPFLAKLYDMVAEPATDTIVSWASAGGSFVMRDSAELYTDLLPKYFEHNNILKFVRQLITYGFRFRKVDHGLLEFAREGFVRRHEHKQIESRSSHGYGYSREEFKELPEEIKDLKEEMMVTNDVMFMLTEELKELTEEIKDLNEEMVVTKYLMSVFTEELKLMVERLREPPQADEIDIDWRWKFYGPKTAQRSIHVLALHTNRVPTLPAHEGGSFRLFWVGESTQSPSVSIYVLSSSLSSHLQPLLPCSF